MPSRPIPPSIRMKVRMLTNKILALQELCPHHPVNVHLSYTEKEYPWSDGWNYSVDTVHTTHFHCQECGKKWTAEGQRVTPQNYAQGFKKATKKSVGAVNASNKAVSKPTKMGLAQTSQKHPSKKGAAKS